MLAITQKLALEKKVAITLRLLPWLPFVLYIFRVIALYLSSDDILISSVPDDAFYYIVLAKNWAQTGIWTFNGDIATTGFHPLHAHLLGLFFKVVPEADWHTTFLVFGLAYSFLMGLSCILLNRACKNIFGDFASIGSTLIFFSPIVIQQTTSLMEFPLVVLFSSVIIYIISATNEKQINRPIVFFSGLLGALSRSDFGAITASLAFSKLLFNNKKWQWRSSPELLAFIGAAIGTCLFIAYTFFLSGHFTQGSAATKFFWSKIAGHSLEHPIGLLFKLAVFFAPLTAHYLIHKLLAIFLLLLLVYTLAHRTDEARDIKQITVFALIAIFFYTVFYSFNSQAIQSWYAANFVIPLGILYCYCVHLTKRYRAATLLFIAITSIIGAYRSATPADPQQIQMMDAAISLRSTLKDERIGSWNAGIIHYFSQKPVFNIDGLTNDEAIPYIKSGNLYHYIKQKNIQYIVDYSAMLENPQLALRGGYGNGELRNHLIFLKYLDSPKNNAVLWCNSRIALFKVN